MEKCLPHDLEDVIIDGRIILDRILDFGGGH
jgi:hypothetical protein